MLVQGWAGVCATAAPAAFAFLAMAHRETLMDLNDEAGDRASGVWTLPVVAGPRAALAAAAALLAGAAAVACGAALRGGGLAWVVSACALAWLSAGSAAPACQHSTIGPAQRGGVLLFKALRKPVNCSFRYADCGATASQWARSPAVEVPVRFACAVLVACVMRPAFAALTSVRRSSFDPETVSAAVGGSLKIIGLGMLVTAALV